MKNSAVIVVIFFCTATAKGQEFTDTAAATYDAFDAKKLTLSPALGYNFSNKGSWTNLNPEIFLGCDTLLYSWASCHKKLRIRFGPTVSAATERIDVDNYFRAMMLSGPVNFSAMLYGTDASLGNKIKFIVLAGSSLKVIGNSAYNGNIMQSNFKTGGGIELMRLFMISMNYTFGWHDITNESEINFQRTFQADDTFVHYLSLNLEGYSPATDLFLFVTWYKFLNPEDFGENTYIDSKIITIGMRKDLNLINQAHGR